MQTIKIKPHHFLDVLKLHGKGRDIFVPDENYGHDFYKIANDIVNCKVETIVFTIGSDDICKPCKFNNENKCSDKVANTIKSKELHNVEIDNNLMRNLNIKEGQSIKFMKVLEMFHEKLSYNTYKNSWHYSNDEEIEFRYKYSLIGLGKIISKYNQ